ncbi:putative AAA family ATPase/60S ribosome export protein Rix7 [Aspergillus brunneoviolaceus CBS 621.78]|uniref:AAA family ATPase/60S ribosome export protein Rix7 n=2 Tax=Aspergillus TaxID=5052 RepID=A0A8G1VUY2_9EURO|nr:AAA family ATPase/60S ribosome export protein Rix7 [Aspergillus brunneoviolaceus CBS 621.78]XP_040797930.1 AAA family ATPase/60S ribosome export protein Rix7 [Aspergillus fijiensis CBS 313.89]RAH45499.1 AAA family ATPase/60S ribosome export protein Rix7 [Aspergillus brunneoviolaceus CBS 621.78]RAK73920.1 AAA family ATPase/60S ribosome export protein Rix7 [Aspergillus fijiensis CBS 313.89]
MGRGGRPSLRQGLDKDVYQIVRKIMDEQAENGATRISVTTIYDTIKRSNSSLNRKPKRILEDSIERVVAVIQGDEEEEDSVEGDFEGLEEPAAPESNSLNKSLVGMWNTKNGVTDAQKSGETNNTTDNTATTPAPKSSTKKRHHGGESTSSKRRKGDTAVDRSPPTHVSLADLGGLDDVVEQLGDLVILPMTRPQVYMSSNVQPPRGVLLHGPPGCGKTMIANAFAAELGVPFISISAPSVISGMSGESEKALREYFEEARRIAPCLIFIDEIDAITPKRESAQREMEKRIVAQLLTCMDDLALEKTDGKPVIVLAATNRPDSLDAALRRGGRFDKEINMTVPSEPVREQILRALTRKMRLADDLDLKLLAKRTPGFVGADLNDLVATAGAAAIKRYLEILKQNSGPEDEKMMDMDLEDLSVTDDLSPKVKEIRRLIIHAKDTPIGDETQTVLVSNADFFTALPKIQPSSKREGFATIPDTTWADIGALGGIRDELSTAIVDPIRHPEIYANVGITAPTGVLLWGPPGCGKTLLAKAVANESRANFISVKGPELLNKFVGESERAVRQVFVRARSSVPCVIFFDELDALVPRRDDTLSEASARVVNTLLTELDGLGSSRQGIYVIAATNRPDIIDPAMLRPGRLETLLFVNLPSPLERADILQTLVRKLPIEFDDNLRRLAEECEGFSGADLGSLLRRAGYSAIKRRDTIKFEDFVAAKAFIRPSVTDLKKYERLRRDWSGGVV